MWSLTSSTVPNPTADRSALRGAAKVSLTCRRLAAHRSLLSADAGAGTSPSTGSGSGGWWGEGRAAGQSAAKTYGMPRFSATVRAAIWRPVDATRTSQSRAAADSTSNWMPMEDSANLRTCAGEGFGTAARDLGAADLRQGGPTGTKGILKLATQRAKSGGAQRRA